MVAQKISEGLAGSARDQHAQNVGAGVIEPAFAGLIDQRQAAQPLHEVVGREIGLGWTGRQAGLRHRLLDRMPGRPDHHGAQTEGEGQEIAHADRTLCRHRDVDRRFEALEHAAVGQFWQEIVDRIVEPELALLDQDQGRRRRDRLGHRGDAEDGVAPHRGVALERLPADRLDMGLAAPAHQRHQAGHGAARDVGGESMVQARRSHLAHGAGPSVAMNVVRRSRAPFQPP